MADQREEAVSKGAPCAWHIHYHMVFPVNYRQVLLDEAVTGIIQETAAEMAERFPMAREAMGTDKHHLHLLCRAHPKVAPGRMCRFSRASQRERSFGESLPSNGCCGAGSLGPTGTMWRQRGSGQTGRP